MLIKRKKINVLRGFTFLEVVVAVFIFSLIMTATAAIFAKMIWAYGNAKAIQRDLEAAQQAMSLMAKSIRTSSVVLCGYGASDPNNSNCSGGMLGTIYSIRIYDYSQADSGGCVEYKIMSNNLYARRANVALVHDRTACDTYNFPGGTFQPMINTTSSQVSGQFQVVRSSSSPPTVGKVTISMEVCPPNGCSSNPRDQVRMQTSVSLRDYSEAGL